MTGAVTGAAGATVTEPSGDGALGLAGWLDARRPAPPSSIDARVRAALGSELGADAGAAHDACLAAAERLLAGMLAHGCQSRAQALDLLAADALATYAFEAAGDEPETLRERARAAVDRFCRPVAGA